MIFQTLIRPPDCALEDSGLIVLTRASSAECQAFCLQLLEDRVPLKLITECLTVMPSGFVIEGVAYGEDTDQIEEAYDLLIKVLH